MAKERITIRLDDEVLEWFKKKYPTGYQSAINDALVAYIRKEKQEEFISDYMAGKVEIELMEGAPGEKKQYRIKRVKSEEK